MFTLFAFIAVTMAAEYFSIEYNKGSYEISELKKCYCYKDDACYFYEKSADNKKILEYVYSEAQNCDGTKPTPEEYTIGEKKDGFTYKLVDKLPEHKFHYFESEKEDCTDKDSRAKVLLAEDNCELDYYSGDLYNKYTLDGNNVKVVEFTDNACTQKSQHTVEYEVDADQCVELEGEEKGKFTSATYTNAVEYVSIEYNKGSYEISEFGKCYCYKEDKCYKYTKHATEATKVNEHIYPLNSNCEGDEEADSPVEYTIGQKTEDDLTLTIITQLPTHKFHYFESEKTDCTDKDSRAKVLVAEDNCERDFYTEDTALYNKYTLDGNKVKMAEYTDSNCQTATMVDGPNNIQSEINANECVTVEGEDNKKGKFIPGIYTPATAASEYFAATYNLGVTELYEFGKCYCFPDDGCYKYEKVTGDTTKVNEFYYEGASDCTATPVPTPTPLTLNAEPDEKDVTYKIETTIPTHTFHYFASFTGDCSDSANMPVGLYATTNCERDYYNDDEAVYRKYTVTGATGEEQISIAQYTDNTCAIAKKEQVPKVTEYNGDTCVPFLQSKSKFILIPYTLTNIPTEYFAQTYNKGVTELYEFTKCYCFPEGCYKYEKVENDATKVNEFYYEGKTDCTATPAPTPKVLTLNAEADAKDMTYKIETTIPTHDFYFVATTKGDCTDAADMPVALYSNDNCERDYYSEQAVYYKYVLEEEEDGAKTVRSIEYTNKECTVAKKVDVVNEYEVDKCIDLDGGKVQFSSAKYALPAPQNNGSAFSLILVALMVVFFLF